MLDDEQYDNYDDSKINGLSKLNFNFKINDRFVYSLDESGNYFEFQTPFLKVLKPVHNTYNKKKTIAKKYLILETNDELDFNNQIADFMYIINKIHETSQEKIRENSLKWFNTEFDDIGLDLKVRRPIDQQKDNEFIKISIPNEELESNILKLTKGDYILCKIRFKGLKVSSDFIMEEIELVSFMTQNEFDETQASEYIDNIIDTKEIFTSESLNKPINDLDNTSQQELVKELDITSQQELVKESLSELDITSQQELVKESISELDTKEIYLDIKDNKDIKDIKKKPKISSYMKNKELKNKELKELKEIKNNKETVKRMSRKIIFI